MNPRSIAYVFGTLLLVTAGAMVPPAICAAIYREGDLAALLISAGIAAGIGLPLWGAFRKRPELSTTDSILIAVFGWIVVSAVSALPFVIHGAIPP